MSYRQSVEFVQRVRQRCRDVDVRSLIRECWVVSWPMALIMLSIFFMGVTDVYVAGIFGKETQAAYGLAYQVYFFFCVVVFALSVGTVAVVSQLFASDKRQEFRQAVTSSLLLAVACGLGLSGLCFLIAVPLLGSVFRISPAVAGLAEDFVRIYAGGMVFHFILITTNGILRASQLIRRSLRTMLVVCGLNVSLSFTLALATPLRFRGIAVATVLSMAVGSIMNFRELAPFALRLRQFSSGICARIWRISWAAGVLQALWQLGAMTLYAIIGRLPGLSTEIMAAYTNGLKIESLIFLPAFAFNMANAAVVGNLLGKNDTAKAYRSGLIAALLGTGVVTVLTGVVLLFARPIAAVLSNNLIVVRESVRYIYISLLFEPVMAWGVILSGALNGAGDTKSVMQRISSSVWLVRIPLAYIGGVWLSGGAAAIWWAMNASILVQTITISRRYFSRKWIGVPVAASGVGK